MSNFMTMGLQITVDKKAKSIAVEFPYGEGIAAEFILTPDMAANFAKHLVMAAVQLGYRGEFNDHKN